MRVSPDPARKTRHSGAYSNEAGGEVSNTAHGSEKAFTTKAQRTLRKDERVRKIDRNFGIEGI